MESRQYCGNRKNCLRTMHNCNCNSDASFQTLHEKVQETLDKSQMAACTPCSLCPSLPYVTAYVNPQEYTGFVSPEMALQRGSAFNNLYWPYNECHR